MGRLDPHNERAAPPGGHELTGIEARLECAGKGPLQVLDCLLNDPLERLVWALAVDVVDQLGNHLGVSVRLKPLVGRKQIMSETKPLL